jgi:hypothetical protein
MSVPKAAKTKLDFDEISDWREFEDLVAAYFREVRKKDKNILDVKVQPSGEGSDGGRDILVTFMITDSIASFERKWVVQCKFYEQAISKTHLSTINIPTLIHEYGADGYLLVCKGSVRSKVSEMFESLGEKCKFGYSYEFWPGNELKTRLLLKPVLIKRYFPEHNKFLESQKRRLKI